MRTLVTPLLLICLLFPSLSRGADELEDLLGSTPRVAQHHKADPTPTPPDPKPDPNEPKADIQGPSTADPASLVVFDATDSVAGPDPQSFRWKILPPTTNARAEGKLLFFATPIPDPKIGYTTYTIYLAVGLNNHVDVDVHEITVGTGPGPTPPVPVIPTTGLTVLIQERKTDRPALPAGQANIFESRKLVDWLRTNCGKDEVGDPDYRIWDVGISPSTPKVPTNFAAILNQPTSVPLPRITITDGKSYYATVPLPKSVDETIALISKYVSKGDN